MECVETAEIISNMNEQEKDAVQLACAIGLCNWPVQLARPIVARASFEGVV